ncbi:hypothetical protein AB3S75_006480 [Citrus x aurantiifolia]
MSFYAMHMFRIILLHCENVYYQYFLSVCTVSRRWCNLQLVIFYRNFGGYKGCAGANPKFRTVFGSR